MSRRSILLAVLLLCSVGPLYAQNSSVSPKSGVVVRTVPGRGWNVGVFRVSGTAAGSALICAVEGVLEGCTIPDPRSRDPQGRVAVRYRAERVGRGTLFLIARRGQTADTGRIAVEVAPSLDPYLPPEDSSAGLQAAALPGDTTGDPDPGAPLPPSVFIDPQMAVSAAPIDVQIEWCAGDQLLNASSRKISFSRTNVTSAFTYQSGFNDCIVETKYSYGTVTPTPTLGSRFTGYICDQAGYCGSGTAYYYLLLAAEIMSHFRRR